MAKAVVIAAPASGSGKTMVTLGLLRALRNRGVRVASAKVGPDYIDPAFHAAASGRPCVNLDPWAMDRPLAAGLLAEAGTDCDLVIVEGVMGLFDGAPGDRPASTADLAAALGLPVILVIDASRQSQSAAALAHGFATFRPEPQVAGIIVNRVSSGRHERMIASALEATGLPWLGSLRRNDSLNLPSRHLGLVQASENQDLEAFIESAASAVARETKLDKFLTIAREPIGESVIRPPLAPLGQRIAVASDDAFAFSYPHVLEGWRKAGAEICIFSPLDDEAPPASSDAVFLPGGYPELHAGRLAANQRFLGGLRDRTGCLVYGECGGFMVLGDALIGADGTSHRMAGLLPLTTSFANTRLALGYRTLDPLDGAPWTCRLRGHEFHYSTIVGNGSAHPLFQASAADGEPLGPIGLRRGRVMGSFAHVICEAR